jgi:hypothetical protein
VTRPKKRKKKRASPGERQLELAVETVQLPAMVAEAPMGEDALEEESRPAPRVRRQKRRRRWWDRYWNVAVGVWLVPFAWIFTDAFFQTLSRAMAGRHGLPFWMKHEFLMFGLGAALWFVWLVVCILKWRRPRPVYLYVLGHELTHAVVAMLFFGKVNRFRATSEGGYIETNRYNFLIALAPYLWPFYSIPILAAWSLSLFLPGLLHYRELFLAGLGFTWMFHLTFTLWMLPKGQTDFRGPGVVFSFALIYAVNVILLTGALVSLAPAVGWRQYFVQLFNSGVAFYNALLDLVGDFGLAVARMFAALLA